MERQGDGADVRIGIVSYPNAVDDGAGTLGERSLRTAAERAGVTAVGSSVTGRADANTAGPDDLDTVLDADPDVLIALGERALLTLARRGVGIPVLPIDAGEGLPSTPARDIDEALGSLRDGDPPLVERPILRIAIGDEPAGRALFDATLVTSEPARISEFELGRNGERVDAVRADGIVVATPAGSSEYAHAAGGPLLAPGSGVVAVVPIAPFAVNPDRWVVPPESLSLQVVRDDYEVTLYADDRAVGTVPVGTAVTFAPAGVLRIVVPPGVSAPIPDQ